MRLNPFYFIIKRLDTIMTLAQDTKAAAEQAQATAHSLEQKVNTLLDGFATLKGQLTDIQNNGGLNADDAAALQSAIQTLNDVTTQANVESGMIDNALAPSPSPTPSPAPAPSGDTGSDTSGTPSI